MATTYLLNVRGIGKPGELSSAFANYPLKQDMKIGTLVALEDATKQLVPIDHTTNTVPLGVVYLSDIAQENMFSLTGTLDEKDKCRKGYRLDLFKEFLVAGFELKDQDWDTIKIGDPVYISFDEHAVKYTKTKPTDGWRVGRVVRKHDKLVKFDLLNMVGLGTQADK